MRITPSSKNEWYSLLLFPFKAYLIIGISVLFLWSIFREHPPHASSTAIATGTVLLGYMLCTAVFAVAALVHFSFGQRKAAVKNIIFAGISVVIMLLLALTV